MAITVNGQILRNLPEQVSKNTEDILELQDTTNLQGDKIAALENSIITDITLNNLEVTGNTVIGNAGSDTLTVTGTSSFAGNVNVTGNVTASGSLAGASASFTGNETVGGNLTVNGYISALEKIVDLQARKRFLEWNVIATSITGVTNLYGKASLSGTHLMFVVCLSAVSGTTIPDGANLGDFALPQWIRDKIVAVWGTYFIDRKEISAYNDDGSTQESNYLLAKTGGGVRIVKSGNLTFTKDRAVRIQFDLLIDTE